VVAHGDEELEALVEVVCIFSLDFEET
jgi:hypothetical protein